MFSDESIKLTYHELREIEGYENITEEEATKITETVFMLSIMAYNAYINKENKNSNNE